jgi:hypothetical protein
VPNVNNNNNNNNNNSNNINICVGSVSASTLASAAAAATAPPPHLLGQAAAVVALDVALHGLEAARVRQVSRQQVAQKPNTFKTKQAAHEKRRTHAPYKRITPERKRGQVDDTQGCHGAEVSWEKRVAGTGAVLPTREKQDQ